MQIPQKPLTNLENFSIAAKFTKKMSDWNHSPDHRKLGSAAAHVLIGPVGVAFAELADLFIHISLATGKVAIIAPTLPFRACFHFKRDLDLSSPLIHLMRAIHSLFNLAILPLICALDPDRAYLFSQPNRLIEFLEKLNKEHEKYADLTFHYNQRVHDIEKLNIALRDKEKNIGELIERRKNLEEQIQVIKNGLPKDQLNAIEKIVQLEQQDFIQDLNNQIAAANLKKENAEQEIQPLKDQIAALEQKKADLNKEMEERDKEQKAMYKELLVKYEQTNKDLEELRLQKVGEIKQKGKLQQQKYLKLEEKYKKLNKQFEDQQHLLDLLNENKMKKAAADEPPPVQQDGDKPLEFEVTKLPPPPPLEDAEEDKVEEEDPVDKADKFINVLDQPDAIPDAKEDPDWWKKPEGDQLLHEAHENLLQAIKNFKGFKPKNDPLRGNKLALELEEKHRRRIDELFNRKGRQGLIDLNRHIINISEFFQQCLDAKKFNPKDLSKSTREYMGSMIRRVKHEPDIDKALRERLDYLGKYLKYLKPRLDKLVQENKAKKIEAEKMIEEQKKAAELEERERKRKEDGLLTKEEALAALIVKPRKKYDNEIIDGIDILQDIGQGVNEVNAKMKFKEFSDNLKIKTIINLDEFKNRLEELKETIGKIEQDKYYKKTPEYIAMVNIIAWLNERNYLPVGLRIVKVRNSLE